MTAPGEATATASIAADEATLTASALDANGLVLGSTRTPLLVESSQFLPAYPRASLRWDALVWAGESIEIHTARAAELAATISGRTASTWFSHPGTAARIRLPERMPYGRTRLRLRVANAWGVRVLSVPVWSLGWRPTTSRAVLVDKSDFTLYYAEKGLVHKVYPVAIGMPGTPTHVGHFWLGTPRPASGPWGIMRMALSKRRGTGRLPSWGGYYIHGTNQPDTIGTEASHGCVRMYNSGVTDLSRHTRKGLTSVTIRP